MVVLHPSGHGLVRGAARFAGRLVVLTVVLATCLAAGALAAPARSEAAVGELGPPPTEFEAKQALTWLYNNGKAVDTTVDVTFPSSIVIGNTPVMHPNPPPDPWCVRCGYPDPGSSLMYPVLALVSVTTTQGFVASALPESSYRHVVTTSYNGTACTGQHQAEYCPAYYFYRDPQGRWRIAP